MSAVRIRRGALGICVALVILAGCTSWFPALELERAADLPTARGSAGTDLLYVTGGCKGTCVLSYPSAKPRGSLDVAGAGLCSDKHGNVFVATAASSGDAVVYEFGHGSTKPKATLNVPGDLAEGCSVDPTSGNLAVTYLCQDCSYGPVAVYRNAKGTPATYEEPGVYLAYCGYDSEGDLFADGNSSSGFALVELSAGRSALRALSVNQSITFAGQVQWDGIYLAIEDLSHPVIYRFKISGSTATRKGTTQLAGAGKFGAQSWIQDNTVIVPFSPKGSTPVEVGYWKYPAGGTATKVVKKPLGTATLAGVTVSVR